MGIRRPSIPGSLLHTTARDGGSAGFAGAKNLSVQSMDVKKDASKSSFFTNSIWQ